ncbi:MAG: hypothetical protein J3R72DRAFT_450520 [Linnemannia gamsii]|nr:MAG: hypothetical protein J3R72DRAFT_450520 [Linnemannia gamsii]
MVRLHRSSILLATLSITQIVILFVANAAASSGPAPARYKITRPDRAMVVNEFELVGTDKINGDIWEVISNASMAPTLSRMFHASPFSPL